MLRLSDDTIRNLHDMGISYRDAHVRKLGSVYEAARFLASNGIPVSESVIEHYTGSSRPWDLHPRQLFSVAFLMADATGKPARIYIPGSGVPMFVEVATYCCDLDSLGLQYYESRPGMLGRYYGLPVQGDLSWGRVAVPDTVRA